MTQEEVAVTLKDHENQIKSLKHRVNKAEQNYDAIQELAVSVKELAVNMSYMTVEQKEQGERLGRLEREPVDNHKFLKNTIISCVVTGVVSSIIGAIMGLIFTGGIN